MRRPVARRARRLAVALTAACASACADDGPTTRPGLTVVDVAAVPCDSPLAARGVGVVVADDLVATAAHVVDGPRRDITVDGAMASVVAVDPRTDLALLAANVDGDAELVEEPVGDLAVHTPAGALDVMLVRTGTLTVHDTSAGARHEREAHTIRPGVADGTSGAPLVDASGGVAGIVLLDNPTDGTAYAVTSRELAALVAAGRDRHAAHPCPE